MSMPPAGILGVMDEETLIEAEIAQQLEYINLDDDEDLRDIEAENNDKAGGNDAEFQHIPQEVHDYIHRLQEQTSRFEKDLQECDELLQKTVTKNGDNLALLSYEDHKFMERLAAESGMDIEQYKTKLLEDMEKEVHLPINEDEDKDLITEELSGMEAENETSHGEIISTNSSTVLMPLIQAEGANATENKALLPLGTSHAQFRKDFKKTLKDRMEEIDRKHRECEERLQREISSRKKEEEVQEMRIQEERNLRQRQREKEEMMHTAQRMLLQRKLEEEEKERNEELKLALKQIEKNTREIEIQTQREKAELLQIREELARKEEEKRNSSALLIQRMFKGYRVRRTHASVLIEKQKERRREREQNKQREIEELEKKVQEEVKIQEELKRQKLKEEREEEEESKRKEAEDKQRLEEDKKRQKQLEKKQKEEEKQRQKEKEHMRKQEEKRHKEEENRRLEEEKRKKKEEEKRQKEEEVRKKEEKRLKEEEERRTKEKLRKDREKQQEERKIKKEEERKKKEEETKKQEDKKKQEEERKKMDEERKQNEEEEKRQREKAHEKSDLPLTAPEHSFSQQNILQSSPLNVYDSPQQNVSESQQQKSLESSPQKYLESSKCLESTLQMSLESPPHNSQEYSSQMAHESLPQKTIETKASDLSSLKERKTSPLSVDILPEPLETQRLNWMKNCISWSRVSNEPWKLKPATSKKPHRRPSSSKTLPLLSENVITAAARAESLRQVTTVQLQDLPGHNISPLGQCWGLKYLAVTNSALVAIEGLQQCKQLQYINFTNNKIEYLDLKDLGNLQYLDVSWNQLTALHGLDNCTNLRLLDASHNRISRIGGLESLRRLHTLLLSNNQLISTKGLEDIPTVQVLDFSDNHLQNVDALDKLCLLLKIDVSRNSLVQVPLLQNQVLLQELLLEDNSIASLETLSNMWIPLLHTFHLGQNGISEIHQIRHCLMLKDLSLRNNQLLDHKGILEGIIHCIYLEKINLEENPVLEDISKSDLMDQLEKLLPRLQSLNGANLQSEGKSPLKPRNSFEAMCLTQIRIYRDLFHHLQTELRMAQEKKKDLSVFCDLYFKYCDKTFHLAVEHRYAHEYGEIPITMPTAPAGPKSKHPKSARTKIPPKEDTYMTPKEMFEKALQSSTKPSETKLIVNATQGEYENSDVHNGMINGDSETIVYVQVPVRSEISLDNNVRLPANVVKKQLLNHSESGQAQAAIKIQSMWKGYMTRKEMDIHNRLWLAAIKIQAYWRGYCERKRYKRLKKDRDIYPRMDPSVLKRLNEAATKIQAVWRGYNLRSRLHAALEYAHFDDDDDDLDFQEVNLDEFVDLNKDLLADDWKPPDTPQLPANYPILKKPPTGRLNSNHRVPPLNIGENSSQPSQPRRAWRNADSPVSDLLSLQERLPHPPSSTLSIVETNRTGMSRKEKKLSEEWGFQDTHTAQLMLQRARKMKYNAERRKKLGKLDPVQKLALFRKMEEFGSHLQPVQQPHRTILPRKEYFQARKDEIERQDYKRQEEMKAMVNRTYEWLHTQVGDYNITDSVINQDYGKRTAYGSESNLPKLDPEMVAGRSRVQLVSSPMSLELQSVESGSVQGDHMIRRLSSGGSVYSEGRSSILPAIKTGSAPTLHTKEKMSWRSPDINRSVGWGGGKKRQAKK
ncbi:hypothetical protein CHS0354_009199 [Potamilus streckersoni]|uniref:Leucine-rich repeat and IQ domain-containing protein 1 n=1 Tax=Potamilus streckersoni TaxID=2493646 RepID=A0AAE0T053_9BIVA|nr:hypothetical protein CHS0354_009199 [Potamilus streckersoni]